MKGRIFTIITILIMVVIFVHSAMPAEMSSIESSVFERFVASILGVAPESVTFAVRKCAHFTEYLVLGLFMMLAAANAKRRGVFFTGLITWIIVTPLAVDEFNGPRGDFYKNMFAKCPAGRPGTADEMANIAELLMSDAGAFITGSTFLADGGATASYYYGLLQP